MVESVLTLPGGEAISGRDLSKLLNTRDNQEKRRKNASPQSLFSNLNLFKLQIIPIKTEPIGHLKLVRNKNVVEDGGIFAIPNISLDLTPDSKKSRTFFHYEITISSNNTVILEALFDETFHPAYRELDDPKNIYKLEPVVREDVIDALSQIDKWQKEDFGDVWFVNSI